MIVDVERGRLSLEAMQCAGDNYGQRASSYAAGMLALAEAARTEFMPAPADKLERCQGMLQVVSEQLDNLRHRAFLSLAPEFPSRLSDHERRILRQILSGYEAPLEETLYPIVFGQTNNFWPESLVEHLADGGHAQVEVSAINTQEAGRWARYTGQAWYAEPDVSIASLLRRVAPAQVGILDMGGPMGDEFAALLECAPHINAPSLAILAKLYQVDNVLPFSRKWQSNQKLCITRYVELLRQSAEGIVAEGPRGIFFSPWRETIAWDKMPGTGEALPLKDVRIIDNKGNPTSQLRYAASLASLPTNQFRLAIGLRDRNPFFTDIDQLLKPLMGQELRQRLTYGRYIPSEVVTFAVASMLERTLRQRIEYLQRDQSFDAMLPSHPYRYVEACYGAKVDCHPEGIFPNDLEAMQWLMDRTGLIMPSELAGEALYTNIGCGPFSWIDLLYAKYAGSMLQIDPARPNLAFRKKWKHGGLLPRYEVGHKFEAVMAGRDSIYKGSEVVARRKSEISHGGFRDLVPESTDICVDSYTKYAVFRARIDYLRALILQRQSLRRRSTSRIVEIGMLGSTGWGHFPYPGCPLTEVDVRTAYRDAGLKILDMTTTKKSFSLNDAGMFVVCAALQPEFYRHNQ